MHQRLHNDGDFVIYKVQVELEYSSKKVWQNWDVMYGHDMPLPSRVRWASDKDRACGREQEPMRSFTACGDCWQQTGINGVFDYNKAAQLATLILDHYPQLRVRIIEQKIVSENDHCYGSGTLRHELVQGNEKENPSAVFADCSRKKQS